MVTPDPATWQANASALAVANSQDGRTAGLSWQVQDTSGPLLFLTGGVRAGWSRLFPAFETDFNTLPNISFGVEMGRVALPGETLSLASETYDWSSVELTYTGSVTGASALVVTLTRCSPAMILDTAKSSLQLWTGSVTSRVITGGNVPDYGTEPTGTILPKYAAYHAGGTRQIATLSGSDTNITPDQPWLLTWLGANSHFVETKAPLYHSLYEIGGSLALPQSYAYQADVPCLLVFENNPTAIRQDAAGGLRITWAGAGGKVAVLPIYGRLYQDAGTTDGWAASFPAALQTLIDWWRIRLLTIPVTVTETYSYNSGTDAATVTCDFTYNTIGAGGTQFAPLAPVVAMVRSTTGWTCSDTVIEPPTACPTEFGPYAGVDGTDTYDWTVTGLAPAIDTRRVLGGGTIDSSVQAKIDAQVDAITGAGGILNYLIYDDKIPQGPWGDIYFLNTGEPLALLADIVPLVSGARRTALLNYLATHRTTYPPETTAQLPPSLVDLGGASVPVTAASENTYKNAFATDWRYNTRISVLNFYGLARYYEVQGTAPTGTVITNCQSVLTGEMTEQDWATAFWFNRQGLTHGATGNVNRLLAGLIGLVSLAKLASDTTQEAQARVLVARAYLLRLACDAWPSYLESYGLLEYPTPASWLVDQRAAAQPANWSAFIWSDIVDSSDDVTSPLFLSQFGVCLSDSTNWRDWTYGTADPYGLYSWRYIAGAHLFAYENITPEIVALLAGSLTFANLALAYKIPDDWYLAFGRTRVGREHHTAFPGEIHQVYKVLALTGSSTADELKVWADIPWTDIGDLFYLDKLNETARLYAEAGGPGITNVTPSAASVGEYAKWTLTFDLTTVATKPDLPYDAAAPTGADGTSGVTVNLLVSNDDWATTKVVPCARWLDYDYLDLGGGQDWWTPTTPEHYRWEGRFAPPTAGVWAYKLEAIDSSGTGTWGDGTDTFTCTVDASAHGFVRPAPLEPRRFAYDDGTLFLDIGCTAGAFVSPYNHPKQQLASYFSDAATAGIKVMRVWLSSHALMGVTGHPWRPYFNGGSELSVCNRDGTVGLPLPTGVTSAHVLWALDHTTQNGGNFGSPYAHLGWIPVFCITPSATYRIRVTYGIEVDLTARNAAGGRLHGFTVKASDTWINDPHFCPEDGGGSPLDTPITGNTGGVYTTTDFVWNAPASRYAHVWLVMQNCEDAGPGSSVFISAISIREDLGGGSYGPEICPATDWDMHEHVNQDHALRWDEALKAAEAAGITLQLVIESKEDNVYGNLNASTGAWQAWNVDTVYGAENTTTITPSRWYQMALWRQVVARAGYSSAVFSFELLNEADAHAAGGYYLAELMAQYMANFTNLHMCSTSTDSDHPRDMWALAPSLAFTDVHCYRPADIDSIRDVQKTPLLQDKFADADDWGDTAAGPPRLRALIDTDGTYGTGTKPLVVGETGLVPSGTSPASDEIDGADGDVAIHKLLWSGGAFERYWYDPQHLRPDGSVLKSDNVTPFAVADRRADYGRIFAAISTFPVHNGHYQPVSVTFSGDGGLLRAVGEQSDTTGEGWVWVDNSTDTFANARASISPTPVSGAKLILDAPAGDFVVTIRNTKTSAVISTSTVTAS